MIKYGQGLLNALLFSPLLIPTHSGDYVAITADDIFIDRYSGYDSVKKISGSNIGRIYLD